jgi:hypothetical protein
MCNSDAVVATAGLFAASLAVRATTDEAIERTRQAARNARRRRPVPTAHTERAAGTAAAHCRECGQTLTLRYRLVPYDGELRIDRLNQLASEWRSS